MNYRIHTTPIHPSLCLNYFNPTIYSNHCCVFISLLLLLHYYCYYKTVSTDKLLRASLLSGAAELTTHLLRLIFILWLPSCQINKFWFYFPQRLLRSPILVGHHLPSMLIFYGETSLVNCGPRSFSLHQYIQRNQALFTFCNYSYFTLLQTLPSTRYI